jgi:hypothetical protein
MTDGRVNFRWPSPEESFLIPSPARPMNIFYCIPTLGVVQLTSFLTSLLNSNRPSSFKANKYDSKTRKTGGFRPHWFSYHKRSRRQWVTYFKAIRISEQLKCRHSNNVNFVKCAGVYPYRTWKCVPGYLLLQCEILPASSTEHAWIVLKYAETVCKTEQCRHTRNIVPLHPAQVPHHENICGLYMNS